MTFEALDRVTVLDQKAGRTVQDVLAAIAESKAQAELTKTRLIASLSERVAVLERSVTGIKGA